MKYERDANYHRTCTAREGEREWAQCSEICEIQMTATNEIRNCCTRCSFEHIQEMHGVASWNGALLSLYLMRALSLSLSFFLSVDSIDIKMSMLWAHKKNKAKAKKEKRSEWMLRGKTQITCRQNPEVWYIWRTIWNSCITFSYNSNNNNNNRNGISSGNDSIDLTKHNSYISIRK